MTTIGHNIASMSDHALANRETGVLLLNKEVFVRSVEDYRLNRAHLRIMGFFSEAMDLKTAMVSIDRSLIAEALKMDVRHVSNMISELRQFGYLHVGKSRDLETGKMRNFYTFGNVDHETIRRDISRFIQAVTSGDPKNIYGKNVASFYRDFEFSYRNQSENKTSGTPKQKNSSPHSMKNSSSQEMTSHQEMNNNSSPQGMTSHQGMKNDITPGDEASEKIQQYQSQSQSHAAAKHIEPAVAAYKTILSSLTDRGEQEDRLDAATSGSTEKSDAKKRKPKGERGTRLAQDWRLPKSWGEWALETFDVSRVDVKIQADKFHNWALSAPGQKGVKLDWFATWKNWCHNNKWKVNHKKMMAEMDPCLLDLVEKPNRPGTIDMDDAHSRAIAQAREEMFANMRR